MLSLSGVRKVSPPLFPPGSYYWSFHRQRFNSRFFLLTVSACFLLCSCLFPLVDFPAAYFLLVSVPSANSVPIFFPLVVDIDARLPSKWQHPHPTARTLPSTLFRPPTAFSNGRMCHRHRRRRRHRRSPRPSRWRGPLHGEKEVSER